MNHIANEATIVAATMVALRSGTPVAPAVATAVARRYQDNIAAFTALQPTLQAFATPVVPQISGPANAADRAAYGAAAARAAANATSITPVAGQASEEAGLMQRATITAATMIALHSGAPLDSAVATAAVNDYQDTNATIAAYQPTPQPTAPPQPILPAAQSPTAPPPPTPDIQRVPVAPAPSNLAGITLPATQAEVVALFRNLPPAVAGQDRVTTMSDLRPGHLGVVYDSIPLSGTDHSMPRIALIGTDQALERSTPDWTGAHVITAMAQQSPDRITTWGRDGHLYWLRVAAPVDPQHTNPNQMLLIGTDTSTWVFQLVATSPEEIDALGRWPPAA